MKHHYLSFLLTLLMSMVTSIASAYVFKVDGIFYNITSEEDLMVEVTYKGDNYYDYSNEYTGSVTIPASVTYNEKNYSVTSIGSSAFGNCTSLTSITIPESVTSIGRYAFLGCSGLISITIPEGVTSIGDYAFEYCSGLASITIPESVASIGDGAFDETEWYNNQPDGLIYVGKVAYKYKGSMPENTQIEIKEGTRGIVGYAFNVCSGLTSITIPESVTSIGDGAFYKCTGLTSITIPKGVTSIGRDAFFYCSGLTSITIPESVTSIGSYAFSGTAWYNNQPDGLVYAGNVAYKYKGTMPENTKIELAEGTKGIAGAAFHSCSGLTSITIPEGVTSIGGGAFSYCSSLTSITLPESMTSIGVEAFHYCSGLTTITIPESVTSIEDFAFVDCYGLTSITIPESVTSIGRSALYYCSGLTSITIPEGVTSIGEWAFKGCSGLTSITIPSSVTSIGNDAFSYCSSLTDVYCYASSVPTTSTYAFTFNNIMNATLHVPAASIEDYKKTSPWSDFGTIVALTPEEVGVESVKAAAGQSSQKIYSLDGKLLQKLQKGINIIGGKKALFK